MTDPVSIGEVKEALAFYADDNRPGALHNWAFLDTLAAAARAYVEQREISDEMVERAAKAAAEADPEWRTFNDWEKLGPTTKKGYRRMARAALEAALLLDEEG